MLETNGNCDYPCWWGITPGTTSWVQVKALLDPVAQAESSPPNHDNRDVTFWITLPDPDGRSWNGHLEARFHVSSTGVVEMMSVPVKVGSIQELLNQYGIPSEIWLSFIGDYPGDPRQYILAFFYQAEGIMAEPVGSGTKITENGRDYLEICGSQYSHYYQLRFWSLAMPIAFYDVEYSLFETTPDDVGFGRIGDVTDLSEDLFYALFMQNPDFCFRTPYDRWPIIPPRP